MSRTDLSDIFGGAFREEDLLTNLLESISDVVWCTTLDGEKLLFINRAAEKIYGKSLDELTQDKNWWLEAVHPEDRQAFQHNLRKLIDLGSLKQVYRIVRSDGEIRWLQDRLTVILDESNVPQSVGGITTDITERVEFEEKLRESDAVFHSLVENLPLNVIRKDLQSKIVFANQRFCDLIGFPLEELVGKSDFDLFPANLARKYIADDRKVLKSNQVLHEIEEHQAREGTTQVEVFKGPVVNDQGKTVGIQILFWDITDQKKIEEAYNQERYLLNTLLENVPDWIYFKDANSKFIRISKSLADKFELHRPEDAAGMSDADFFSEQDAIQRREDELNLMRGEQDMLEKIEHEDWGKNGETWVYTTKLKLRDTAGAVVGTFGISRDITEEKRVEADLARERDLLKTIINNLPDIIFVKDRYGRFVTANEAMLRSLKLESLDHLVGKNDYDFFSAEMACNFVTDDQIVMRSGESLMNQEESSLDGDGNPVWLLTAKVPLRNANGEIVGLVGIGRDITASKESQVQLERAKTAADQANRAKSDFLSNMSHEIRTPMNAIVGMTELLMDSDLNSSQYEYLRMVQESGQALMTVLNDILDFSKIEAGKLDLDPEPFDIREILGDTIRSLALRAHNKGIELAFRIQRDVPKVLIGDCSRFRQVIVNLVGNAIKFTEQGEVVVEVACDLIDGDDVTLHASVRDTGIGIPQEIRGKIFGDFQQADSSTTRRYGGTGLGLAISSRLVELMQGRIWVDSRLGVGSEFHFTIKLQSTDQEIPTASPVIVGGRRVLLVDDNNTNRLILDELLTSWGMVPIQAEDVKNAILQLQKSIDQAAPIDLILTDVNMPIADGFDLAEWVRGDERFAQLPIIMLTSGGRTEDANRRNQLRIAGHMMKPVKQSELFNRMVRALGVSSADDQTTEAKPLVDCRPLKILLAEDNIVNQRLALGVLKPQNHEITVVENGRKAVEMYADQPFDLILMDIQMPVMNGLEATREIRKHEIETGKHVTIVAMTAHAMKGDREKCINAGMDEYLSKPIRIRELQEKLAELFGTKVESRPAKARTDSAGERQAPGERGRKARPKPAAQAVSFPDNNGVIDWQAAYKSVNYSESLLRELIQLFLDDLPRLTENLRQAVLDADQKKLKSGAHLLKGSMLFLHSRPSYESAMKLEQLCKKDDLSKADALLEELELNLETLSAELNDYLRSPASS
jgi:PAS domain S-box-containing protein